MAEHVCPVWIGYWLASPIRKLWQHPVKILESYVREGMTVLDIGSAMGFFSIPMARLVGSRGKVVCVDLQEKMVEVLIKKAAKKGLTDIIETVVCSRESLNIDKYNNQIDFALMFAVLHEIPDQNKVLNEVYATLKPAGKCLLSEPAGHVNNQNFNQSLSAAEAIGFTHIEHPKIRSSHSALLQKKV